MTNFNLRPNSINHTSFLTGRQEDAVEFLHSLIECLQQNLGEQGREDLWNLLGSTLEEQFQCEGVLLKNCPILSAPPVDYHGYLPLPVTGSTSVQQSFQMLLCSEEFRERNCPNPTCRSELASSTTLLTKLPKMLILQLTRFTSINGKQVKLKDKIKVSHELTPVQGGPVYVLTGAVIHTGERATSGHYVSAVVCPKTGNVFVCDDASYPVAVQTADFADCSFADVLERAYILIYSLKDETLEAVHQKESIEPNAWENSPLKKKTRFTTSNVAAHSRITDNVQTNISCNQKGDMSATETNQTQFHEKLPTTMYTNVNKDQRKQASIQELSTMNKVQLIDYYKAHINRHTNLTNMSLQSLQLTIYKHVFQKSSINNETALHLLKAYNIKPHTALKRIEGQLRHLFFASNKEDQEYILNYIASKSTGTKPETQQQQEVINDSSMRSNALTISDQDVLHLLKKYNVKPHTALKRRLGQLKKLYKDHINLQEPILKYINRSNTNVKLLASLLPTETEDVSSVDSTKIENVQSTQTYNKNPDACSSEIPQTQLQDELPTPEYTSVCRQNLNSEETNEKSNVTNLSREELVGYYKYLYDSHEDLTTVSDDTLTLKISEKGFQTLTANNHNVLKLLTKFNVKPQTDLQQRIGQLKTVYLNSNKQNQHVILKDMLNMIKTPTIDFDSLSIIDEDVCKLLKTFNIKPHDSINRRYIQLKTFFVNNPDMQNFIKSYIENSLAEIERVALKGESK